MEQLNGFKRHEEATQSVLMAAGIVVPVSVICEWSRKEVADAENYATQAYYHSLNNVIKLPAVPDVLASYVEVEHG